jgi:ATP-dependent Zn protease
MLKLVRRFIFGLAILFVAVVCWRFLTDKNTRKTLEVPASVFAQTPEGGKVQKVSILMGYDSADLEYTEKDRSVAQNTTVSTHDLPNLIKKMIDNGATVDFASVRKAEPANIIPNLLPISILFGLVGCSYYLHRRISA